MSTPRPWYREAWPWFLMAGPAIVVIASFVTFYIAWSTDDGVIAEDYYKQGLSINRQLGRVARAEALHLGALTHIGADGTVRLELTGLATDAEAPAALRLRLVHPTRAGQDRVAQLARGADGAYAGWIEPPAFAHWHVVVESDAWELPAAVTDGKLSEVRLGTAR